MLATQHIDNITSLLLKPFIIAGIIFSIFFTSSNTHALTVHAEGQAYIVNGDIASARRDAINRAKQQALLQSSAYISTQPHLEQDLLSANNVTMNDTTNIGDADIIKESRSGGILSVLISVRINTQNKCTNGKNSSQFRKRVAIAGFPLANREHASIGQLGNIETTLARELIKRLNRNRNIETLNAGHLMLQPDVNTAVTEQLPQGKLTTVLQQTRQLEVQYVVSGVVRDLSLMTPSVFRQKNYAIDLYNKLDYLSSKYMRAFEVELFIHDGFTGSLIKQTSYRTAGLWSNNDRQKFGFASNPFWKLDYGKQVSQELDRMASEINNDIRCNDFSVEIARTNESKIWFKAGKASGVKIGDKFDVYRKSTFYDYQQNPTVELEQTDLELTVSRVQSNSAEGIINGLAGQSNIQTGDVLISK